MSEGIIELIDTALKIGLGALIAGFVAVRVTKLKHQQAVVESAVRRRLEVIEGVTAGVAEFANAISRYCAVSENILNAIYRQDSTIGEPPPEWVKKRDELGSILKSGSALQQPEGLLYLISVDERLPKALFDLQRLAELVMNSANADNFGDVDFIAMNKQLDQFKRQAAFLMAELGKVYRSPTI